MLGYLRSNLQSLVSIGVRGASVLAGFVVTYYIGHAFGPLANGQYALIAQTGMFLSIVAVGGMDLAIVRYFSATQEHGIPLGRQSLFRAVGYSLGVGLLIVVGLAVTNGWILATLFHGRPPDHGVVILACVVMTRTATRVTGAVLRSQNRHLLGQIVEVLAIPLCVAALLGIHAISSLQQVLYATALAGLVTGAFGIIRSFAATSTSPNALDVPFAALFRTSLPLWLTVIAMNVADWWNLATAATALGVYEAGLFRVAFQIGTALSFSATGINNVFTARISAAIAVGDLPRIAKLSRSATRLSAVVLMPVVVVLFVGGDRLLGLIGPRVPRCGAAAADHPGRPAALHRQRPRRAGAGDDRARAGQPPDLRVGHWRAALPGTGGGPRLGTVRACRADRLRPDRRQCRELHSGAEAGEAERDHRPLLRPAAPCDGAGRLALAH